MATTDLRPMSRTQKLALLREIRADALAMMKALEYPAYTPAWYSDRLYQIDGNSAMLREAFVGEEF